MATVEQIEYVSRQADARATAALWYAWGFVDSGTIPGLNLDHGFEFSREQKQAAVDYYSERTHKMDSVINAWDNFLRRKGLRK